ncbi:DUF397 domain-containing protein [Actinocatenispora sera]|uniref:DUF397 domain-containing protein n=1 Tax=Actinocatenispora sera TaxID=390989 RepID=UPI0033F7D4C2
MRWWKSGRSGNQGACVEVAASAGTWYIRDSKNPSAGHLTVDVASWRSFIAMIKAEVR